MPHPLSESSRRTQTLVSSSRRDRAPGAVGVSATARRPGRGARAGAISLHFLAVLAGLTLVWWAVVAVLAPPPFLLPGPDRVARAFVARFDELMWNTFVTVGEILLGLVVGVGFGIVTALVMGVVPWTARLIQPVVVVVQALPVFAIAPVLVLWLGFGLASKIVMAAIVIFFPVASAFHDGIVRADPGLLDLARLHRATTAQTFRFIRLPGAVPGLVSGLRMAATLAPIGAIIGEWVGASQGLGLMMMHANARMQTDVMFAALVLVALSALALRAGVDLLTRRWAPWAPDSGGSLMPSLDRQDTLRS